MFISRHNWTLTCHGLKLRTEIEGQPRIDWMEGGICYSSTLGIWKIWNLIPLSFLIVQSVVRIQ